MQVKDNKEEVSNLAGVFFFVGLIMLSLAVGQLAPNSQWGWVVLGLGLMLSAILEYLEPKSKS